MTTITIRHEGFTQEVELNKVEVELLRTAQEARWAVERHASALAQDAGNILELARAGQVSSSLVPHALTRRFVALTEAHAAIQATQAALLATNPQAYTLLPLLLLTELPPVERKTR